MLLTLSPRSQFWLWISTFCLDLDYVWITLVMDSSVMASTTASPSGTTPSSSPSAASSARSPPAAVSARLPPMLPEDE